MIDIADLILELRPDLRRRFGFDRPENADAWLAWLVTTGSAEYAALKDAPSFRAELARKGCGPGGRLTRLQHLVWLARPDVQKAFALPRRAEEYRGWFYTHGLEEHGYWAYLSEGERKMVLALSAPWRIRVIEATLPRAELLALYKACDCFLSLHRAEGFGRGIAEALQLGLHVIATGYSGNVDFCRAPHADLVRYRLVKVKKGQYPYGEGQVWAEADVDHAAELMRNFVACKRARKAKADWSEFSARVVGERYRRRLREIGGGLEAKLTQ